MITGIQKPFADHSVKIKAYISLNPLSASGIIEYALEAFFGNLLFSGAKQVHQLMLLIHAAVRILFMIQILYFNMLSVIQILKHNYSEN